MNEVVIGICVFAAIAGFLWLERAFDRLPASHWVNQLRKKWGRDGYNTDGDFGDGGCGD
ncbi:hypothetical protein Q4555_15020 [Octadecabacter sp. 1_MG-2023]|uniref:hypothetical protein n=1 Tax=unclassified Octadecabacter TaxID=196158 RepID=UPI001C0906D4|nr:MULTISPECIES: hypothetical protein [unclassified Octadecabacter]MBU2992014.1 hypothetical protein [Octadecabacter sp. B2R22]MDO6735989.1 hypothetical protein [Octadecabacter sp. 1_MG-2023]